MISVVIPVKNEAANLPGCLESLGGNFDEVIVVDSGSSDETRQIAERSGATVLDFRWNGKFPKKRNWTLRNQQFRNPWVLFLDADERLTPEVIAELKATLPTTRHVGFWLSYNNWFMNRPMRHGDPFRKLALFRVGSAEFEQFPEDHWCNLDMEVHEHPMCQGTVGAIRAKLEHHDRRLLENYIAKHNEYSSWEANRYRWLQSTPEAWSQLTGRQKWKYRYLRSRCLAPAYFLATYVLKAGFLDGSAGWTFANLKRRYFEDVRLKIIEAEQDAGRVARGA